jgi:DNA invertase Pin-like site-specific DNA recombinase
MSSIGYARVSTTDQTLDIQIAALKQAGCGKVFSEQVSGNSVRDRPQLLAMMEYVREGDVLVITRIDRLARSLTHLLALVEELKAKGVMLKAIEQPITSDGSPASAAFLAMLGVFAEFEQALRKERQSEGIAAAKANGTYKNRKSNKNTPAQLEKLRGLLLAGMKEGALCKELGVSRATLYTMKKKLNEGGQVTP